MKQKKIVNLTRNILENKTYDYGCIMAEIPPTIGTIINKLNIKLIPDNILYEDSEEHGREDEYHVTIKYGLIHSYTPHNMINFFSNVSPFSIRIIKIDIFENDEFDVVKLNIDGDYLRYLNSICSKFPNDDKYKTYNPHMTLAYVKSGQGKKLKKISIYKQPIIPINTLIYSNKGVHTRIPL